MTCTARRHKSLNAYRKHGCRCPEAREAMRVRWRRQNKARYARQRPERWVDRVIDEIAIERACNGDPVRLSPAERRIATARLDAQHLSATEIARRLRITTRTVLRHRAARRTTQETK